MKRMSKQLLLIMSIVFIVLVLAACGATEDSVENEANEQEDASLEEANNEADSKDNNDWPEKLSLGVIPSEDQANVSDRVRKVC